MLEIKSFTFNPFMEKTYLLIDEKSRETAVIDAGMNSKNENEILEEYIQRNNILLKHHILTHAHVDHVLGSEFILKKYGLYPEMHKDGLPILKQTGHFVEVYGLSPVQTILPKSFLKEGDKVNLGKSELQILHTPGHADGSICIVSDKDRFIITGDVLFKDSIGRTDLPTGDFDLLMHSIKKKLFILGNDYRVYPGHGGHTNIGYEKSNNPFVI
jgi:glyoxylase-like metal-dependent hydrolase (beta-lactamase superfamily II)